MVSVLSKLTTYIPSPWPKFPPQETPNHSISDSLQRETREYQPVEVRPQNHLGIQLGQHITVAGKTGSGKSRFGAGTLEYLRRQYPHAKRYVLDSTADGMPDVFSPVWHYGNTAPDTLSSAAYTQIWQPDTDDLDQYNRWLLKILYRREPAIVWLDEIASLVGYSKTGGILEGHEKLLKQGRKHGITVINSTQEIAHVPPQMFRQMSYFVQFRLNNDIYELSRARAYLDVSKDDQHQPYAPYGFFLKHTNGNFPAKEYRSMQELFGKSFRVLTS